jgi:hypothetical protein
MSVSDSTSKRLLRDRQRLTYISLANLDHMKSMLESTTLGAHEDTVFCTRTYAQYPCFAPVLRIAHLPCICRAYSASLN